MIPGPPRTRGTERGQATVELVLLLPIVVLLVLTVVQVGLVVRDRLLVVHAAREAARTAAVDPRHESAVDAAVAAGRLQPDRLDVSLSGGRSLGDRLTVRVGYLAPTEVPIVGPFVPDIALSAEVTVRVE